MKEVSVTAKKYLIISNNLFSYNNANGKYLRNYLSFLDNDEICNFYLSNDEKSNDESFDTFKVSDKDVLKMFKTLGFSKIETTVDQRNTQLEINKSKQSSLKHILRYFAWNLGFWKRSGINSWINKQNPKAIITLIGNNPYLMKFAYKTSRNLKIPLIVFVCEDYPFKNYDYLKKNNKPSFLYKKFRRLTYRFSKILLESSELVTFNSAEIRELYTTNNFKIKKSLVCFPPSNMIPGSPSKNIKNFLYAGNLSLGRVDALIEFATTLNDLKYTQKLDVYGNMTTEQERKIKDIKNIIYHGYVTNDELMKIYSNAGILIHVEHNNEYNKMDLKYAFSTKIADLISSGKRILLYAPRGLCETEYFLRNLPNNVATKIEELPKALQYVTSDGYDFNIQNKVAQNHNIKKANLVLEKEIRKL